MTTILAISPFARERLGEEVPKVVGRVLDSLAAERGRAGGAHCVDTLLNPGYLSRFRPFAAFLESSLEDIESLLEEEDFRRVAACTNKNPPPKRGFCFDSEEADLGQRE